MEQIGIALLIFGLRVVDVSMGTLRVLYTVRGRRRVAAALGVVEAGVFILAISRVFKHVDNPLSMLGYALGFAAGTVLGMTLEKWIGSGFVLLRIISREDSARIRDELRQGNFGVTVIHGEGRQGPVLILFVVAPRKRGQAAMRLVESVDPEAFVTAEPVGTAKGGHLPLVSGPAGIYK